MKLGFITSILDQYGYEQMIDTAAEMGFSCVEVACWPDGKAERRKSPALAMWIGAGSSPH